MKQPKGYVEKLPSGRFRARRPNLLYSPKEYAARLLVSPVLVLDWLESGLPKVRNWLKRPPTVGIPPQRADTWVKRRHREVVTVHPCECVYFVQRGDGAIKIGFTNHLDRRFRELRSEELAAGSSLTLIGCLPGDRELEREWHNELALFGLGGEWFDGDCADEIRGQCAMERAA